MFKEKSASIFHIHPASNHFSSPLPLTMLKVTIPSCVHYSPYLPSGLPASSLAPCSLYFAASSPLKRNQIMSFLQNLPVAPMSLGMKARAFSVLGGPTRSSPPCPLISSPATLALSLSALPTWACDCPS